MNYPEIEAALRKYLPKGNGALSGAMRYSVFSGGKRIRPVITIEASKACGGGLKDALPSATAIELVHTYSLIHDDLPAMDDDDIRRGKPTCHKKFGEANAILAGDALLTLAFNIIAADCKALVGISIIRELSDAIGAKGMVGGQALDLEFQSRKSATSRVEQNKINLLKTAKLFGVAAKIGAISAGASAREIRAMERFGLHFGSSFQMVDDYLDGEGNGLKEAAGMIKKAKNSLSIFGAKAGKLMEIADYLLKREGIVILRPTPKAASRRISC